MAVEVSSKVKPLSGNSFAIADAMDIEMPDGSRLSELDVSGISAQGISEHNKDATAHDDIRQFLSQLNVKLNNFLDASQEDLDQLSEIITYIQNNKDLIDGITTGKVNVKDIIDNLESEEKEKPLSANQGRVLAELLGETVKIISQELTNEQKEIARNNIGAMSSDASVLPEVGNTEENLLFSSGGEWIPISASRFTRKTLGISGFQVKPSSAEVGNKIDSVVISWSTNFPTNSSELNGETIFGEKTELNLQYVDNNNEEGYLLNEKGSFKWNLKVTGDFNESSTASGNLNFYYGVFTGSLDADGVIDEAAIESMSKSVRGSINGNYNIAPGANQKMALAAPTSYSPLKQVKIDGNTYTWPKVATNIPVTNEYGVTTNYDVWMNEQITTVPCTITAVV